MTRHSVTLLHVALRCKCVIGPFGGGLFGPLSCGRSGAA
jgi:hypothetical protein